MKRYLWLALLLPILVWPVRASGQSLCFQAEEESPHGELTGDVVHICIFHMATPTAAVAPIKPTPVVLTPTPTPTRPAGLPTPSPAPTRTPVAAAPTIEVQPGGLMAAIGTAPTGSTLALHAGTYTEQATITVNALTLQPFGDGPVTLDPGCQPYAIGIGSDDVAIRGLTVQNAMAVVQITLDSSVHQAARAIVEGNTIQDYNCDGTGDANAAGVAAYYSGPGQRIVGNVITRRVNLAGDQRGPGDAIWFKSATGAGKQSGGGHYIAQNVITGGWDGIGGEVEGDPHGAFDQNTIIERNTITNCADDGIQLDGGGKNVVAQYNILHECGSGVSFAPMVTGPTYVLNNDIQSSTPGTLGQLICFKYGSGAPTMGTIFVYGNTCDTSGGPGGKGLEQTNSGYQPLTARGNRFTVSSYGYEFVDPSQPTGVSLDGDCIQTSDPTRFGKWRQVAYASLSAFQAASGQEAHGAAAC